MGSTLERRTWTNMINTSGTPKTMLWGYFDVTNTLWLRCGLVGTWHWLTETLGAVDREDSIGCDTEANDTIHSGAAVKIICKTNQYSYVTSWASWRSVDACFRVQFVLLKITWWRYYVADGSAELTDDSLKLCEIHAHEVIRALLMWRGWDPTKFK